MLIALALALTACGAGTGPAQQSRPNVLVLLTDDQTLEQMRVMGAVNAEIGAAGTTFENAFVSNPLCCPSRATLYTGQYTHNHGVIGNQPPEGGYGRLDKSEWLPVWLQRAGYHTVHIGKFMNRYGQDSPPTEVPPGWNEWYTSVDPSTYRFLFYELNENGVVSTYPTYSTDEYSQRAVDAVRRLAPSAQPFFLSVAFLAPHSGSPRETDDPAGFVTPMPAPRHRDAFAAEPLPESPAFDEANVSDKPSFIRRRPRLSAERVAAITENYRQELESLLAVDEGVARVVQALRETDDPAGFVTPMPAPRHRDAFAAEPLPESPAFDEADVSDKPSFIRRRPRLSAEWVAAITENYRQELESLLAVDEGVARVVQALRETGELDDTLIVFTSDNGYFHGEHRVPYGKVMVYEPSIRVPLLLRGPGVPAGQRRRQLVTNADLAPTILAATGARAEGRAQDGRSLFPLLRDRGLAWGRDLLVEGAPGVEAVAYGAVRNDRYVYAEHDNGERELYDLHLDPHQLENVIGEPEYEDVEAMLAERLTKLLDCSGRSCWRGPRLRLAMRGCRVRVRGGRVERVRVRRRGSRLRARVATRDGRVVTLDRRLPRRCR